MEKKETGLFLQEQNCFNHLVLLEMTVTLVRREWQAFLEPTDPEDKMAVLENRVLKVLLGKREILVNLVLMEKLVGLVKMEQ